ncbi:MAG TPA: DNA translocase FtsK, partial [Verrucomicrobiae bacterium]|nr:DNA translocase FtsK [Verrucomicrobiae bacterium]
LPGAPKLPEPAPVEEGEVIPAKEITAATTDDILGRKSDAKEKEAEKHDEPQPAEPKAESAEEKSDAEKSADAEAKPESDVKIHGLAPAKPRVRKPKPITVAQTPLIGNYQLPSLDFLQQPDLTIKPTESKEELMANARLMQQTLAQFDIDVSLGDITKGPTITRYELHPAPGVKLEKITGLSNNIAAALKAERIHILAPVPGKSSVGVEVPNAVKTKVIMRDLFESDEWRGSKARVPIALGKDVYGHPIIADLTEMPHLLIAGSTGSGKSVCINSIIASLLYKFSPDQLRFVMIDPKVVELQHYNALPHLVVPVVTDPKKVILALRWVVNEMEKRYQIFARVGVRNIATFNSRPNKKLVPQEPELPLTSKKEKVEPGAEGFAVEVDEEIVVPREEDIVIPEKLSYIVVIIDELADLMLVAPADVEMAIARITQMARAAGIHCIVATQRPSVDVITGVIKANIPARIAFQVAAKVDSRTILDAMGADKLLGKGDMLYLPPGSAKLIRAQGALITDQEINSIVEFIAKQGKPNYDMEIHQQLSKPSLSDVPSGIDEDEEIVQQCIEVIRSEQKASVSLLQRRLRLGYTRAARIMDELENRGIVGPSKGAEPRDILIDLDGGGADGGGQQAV